MLSLQSEKLQNRVKRRINGGGGGALGRNWWSWLSLRGSSYETAKQLHLIELVDGEILRYTEMLRRKFVEEESIGLPTEENCHCGQNIKIVWVLAGDGKLQTERVRKRKSFSFSEDFWSPWSMNWNFSFLLYLMYFLFSFPTVLIASFILGLIHG